MKTSLINVLSSQRSRTRRYKSNIVVLREIRRYQKIIDFFIFREFFARLCREILYNIVVEKAHDLLTFRINYQIQRNVLKCFQKIIESFVILFFFNECIISLRYFIALFL